jgi:hypothetical protein
MDPLEIKLIPIPVVTLWIFLFHGKMGIIINGYHLYRFTVIHPVEI